GPEIAFTTTVPAARGAARTVSLFLPTPFPQEPGHRYLLTVETPGQPKAAFRLAPDGDLAVRLTADIAAERARSQTIADRQDAADLLESLRGLHARTPQSRYAVEALAEAERLLAEEQPEAAYRAGIRAEQLSLPAAFDLPAPGRLSSA